MLTKTTTNTPKYTDDELRDDWDASIEKELHGAFKRRHAAAMDEPDIAKRDALWAQISAPRTAVSADLERSVTEQAPLVIECLDDVRARGKRPLATQMLPFLSRCILERWRLDASSASAAAATRARCVYPTLD